MTSPDPAPELETATPGPEPSQAGESDGSSSPTSYVQRYREIVQRLGRAFSQEHYPAGELAQLRRLDHRKGLASTGDAFWRIAVRDLEAAGLLAANATEGAHQRWMVILQGLATVRELHQRNARLGRALAKAGISEARLTRLLSAGGSALLAQIRPLAQQLRSKAQAVDWADVADLILTDDLPGTERVRQRIASDYYRQQYRTEKDHNQSTSAASA